jgi:predicted enzyme related to lactoylglutathione lyase
MLDKGLGCQGVFVAIADLDGHTLTNFYGALFEQSPTMVVPDVYTEFEVAGLRVGLFRPSALAQPEFADPSSGSLSLWIEVASLERAIAHLTDLGYPPPSPIQAAEHGREVYAYDPQGNRLILHEGWSAKRLQ